MWRSRLVVFRRFLQQESNNGGGSVSLSVRKRDWKIHLPWLIVTSGALIYAWRSRRKAARGGARRNDGGTAEKEARKRFSGKVVVITGAAGDIGRATATAFAREGASVALVDLPHTMPRLENQCSTLLASGAPESVALAADMTQEEQVQNMVATTVEKLGGIDCFFNNAGIQGELTPVHKQDSQLAKKVIEVNIFGAFLGLKHVSGAMMKSGGGVIVNTSSLAGLLGPRNMTAYAASKHAVIGLTKSAAKDLAPHGVRVCAIAPGLLEGRMWTTQVEGQARCTLLAGEEREPTEIEMKEMEKKMLSGTPMGRLGQMSEVADVVLYLCSQEASYLTGTVVTIDGGRLP